MRGGVGVQRGCRCGGASSMVFRGKNGGEMWCLGGLECLRNPVGEEVDGMYKY